MALPKTITFVTGNAGKLREMQAHLAPLGVTVHQDARGYPEIQADTLQEVARAGAESLLASGLKPPFILEDAGLFVDTLQGFPGPYSAYAQATIGNQGILDLMQGKNGRKAHFAACLTYVSKEIQQFAGRVDGIIANEAAGEDGFGYDPIFVPRGETRNFAQMSASEKSQMSHRGRAIDAFVAWLANQ